MHSLPSQPKYTIHLLPTRHFCNNKCMCYSSEVSGSRYVCTASTLMNACTTVLSHVWQLRWKRCITHITLEHCHPCQPHVAVLTAPILITTSLPAALREAQTCRYFVYSEADFEVFRSAGATRCTDGGEIWHGGGDLRRRGPNVPSSMPNFTPIGATVRVSEPQNWHFTEIWSKCGI